MNRPINRFKKPLKPGWFVMLYLTSIVIGGGSGYFFASWECDSSEVFSMQEQNVVRSEYLEKRKALERSYAQTVSQKRLKYMAIRDVYLPLQTYLGDYRDMWGDKYYTVPEKMLSRFKPVPFQKNLELNERVEVYLRISPDEKQAIEMVTEPALRTLRDEELNNVTVQESTPKSVTLVIKPFPEKGKEIKEQLQQELVRVLGQVRADFILTSREWDSSFLSFGQKQRVYKIFLDAKHWRMTWPTGGTITGIPTDEAGRFYEYLPEEVKQMIPEKEIHHPPNARTQDVK